MKSISYLTHKNLHEIKGANLNLFMDVIKDVESIDDTPFDKLKNKITKTLPKILQVAGFEKQKIKELLTNDLYRYTIEDFKNADVKEIGKFNFSDVELERIKLGEVEDKDRHRTIELNLPKEHEKIKVESDDYIVTIIY